MEWFNYSDTVGLHVLLLGIGEFLKNTPYIDAQKLQDFIAKEESFIGVRVPLDDCRLALKLLSDSGLIYPSLNNEYVKLRENAKVEYPLPDYGDLFTLDDFIEECKSGMFVDSDGSGYYSDGVIYRADLPAYPSDVREFYINEGFTHVIWFNK